MSVVAAGVHDAGLSRPVREVRVRLHYRQRVHVGAQADAAVAPAAADCGNDAVPPHARLNFRDSQLAEPIGHKGRRFALLQSQARACVQVAAPVRKLGLKSGVH